MDQYPLFIQRKEWIQWRIRLSVLVPKVNPTSSYFGKQPSPCHEEMAKEIGTTTDFLSADVQGCQ